MPESQWLSQNTKRKNYLWLILTIAAVCIAAVIFIRNNSDILQGSADRKKDTAAIVTAQAPASAAMKAPEVVKPENSASASGFAAEKKGPVIMPVEPQQPAANARSPIAAVPGGAASKSSVALTGITCRLLDKSQPSIRLSLSLVFAESKPLEREILMKRDNLRIMVQKILGSKSLDDMVVDSLRKDLKAGLNSLLDNGAITDIEFKEFRIDKAD